MKKIKSKIVKLATALYSVFGIFTIFAMSVYADVTFDQAKAVQDIKALLDPVANCLLIIALPVSLVSIAGSFLSWNAKDDQEKESMPFVKAAKKQLIAFAVLGLASGALKWFTIS